MMTGRYVHEMDTTNNGQGLARSTKTGKLDSGCVAAWNATSFRPGPAATTPTR